jgi:hypothetical protein
MAGIDSYTKLCCHLNSNYADSSASAHTLSGNGSAAINTSVKKFGAGSLLVPNVEWPIPPTDYLKSESSSDWNIGTGNFTIDTWVNFTDISSWGYAVWQTLFGGGSGGASKSWCVAYNSYWFENDNPGCLKFTFYNGSGYSDYYSEEGAIGYLWEGTWFHIAVVRDGNTLRFFVDGADVGTSSCTSANFTISSGYAYVGCWAASGGSITEPMMGYVDELRLSVGTARWTTDFSVPTAEYTSDAPPATIYNAPFFGTNF